MHHQRTTCRWGWSVGAGRLNVQEKETAGPRSEPCGTSDLTGTDSDLASLTSTACSVVACSPENL